MIINEITWWRVIDGKFKEVFGNVEIITNIPDDGACWFVKDDSLNIWARKECFLFPHETEVYGDYYLLGQRFRNDTRSDLYLLINAIEKKQYIENVVLDEKDEINNFWLSVNSEKALNYNPKTDDERKEYLAGFDKYQRAASDFRNLVVKKSKGKITEQRMKSYSYRVKDKTPIISF